MTRRRPATLRARRAVAVATAALALLGAGVGAAVAAPAGALVTGTAAAAPAAGLGNLNACVNARTAAGGDPTLRLAVVIDESRSLKDSDPGGARVTAAKALVSQLAAQAERQKFTIAALVAGFSSAVDNSTGFQSLTTADVGTFTTAIDAFAARNTGQDTDYWAATQQIRTLFADARGAADPTDPTASPCQAVVLVTDGQFDLTVRDTTEPYPGAEGVTIDSEDAKNRVVQAGRQDLCRAAGPVDALRADDITLIAVGLKGEGGNNPDFGLLQGMATGSGGCGAQPPNGAFFEADDVSDLILILATIGSDGGVGETTTTAVCARGSSADDCTRTFDLSPAFTSAKLLTAVDADGIGVQITTADGKKPAEIDYDAAKPSGSVAVNGVMLAYQWYSPRALSIDVTGRQSSSWNGTWRATFIDTTGQAGSAVAKTQFSVQPDLYVDADLTGDTADGLRPGEDASLGFAIRNGLKQTLTKLDDGLSLTASVTVTPKTAGAAPVTVDDDLTAAEIAAPYTWAVPDSLPTGSAVLTVTTTVKYKTTTYAATERQQQVSVLPPFTAPTVSGTVAFPMAEGTSSVSSQLTVQAPQQGAGCVWVDGAALTAAPAALTSVTVTGDASSEASCQQIAAGSGSQQLTLTLTPGAEANGDLVGTVDVHLKPQGGGAASVVPVRFTGSVERTPQGWVFYTVLALSILLGVLVPAAVYALIRRRGARFPTATLHHVTCSAVVAGPRLEVGRDTHRQVLQIDASRRSARAGDHTLRAVVGWKPTEAGHAEISRAGWAGVGELSPYQRDGAAVVSVALAGSWSVFVPRQGPLGEGDRVDGELFLVIPAAASDDFLQQLRDRAAAEFHQRYAQLVEAVGARTPELVGVGAGGGDLPPSTWVDPAGPPSSSGSGSGSGWGAPPTGAPAAPPSSSGWGAPPPAGPAGPAGPTPSPAPGSGWGAPPGANPPPSGPPAGPPPSGPPSGPPAGPPPADRGWWNNPG